MRSHSSILILKILLCSVIFEAKQLLAEKVGTFPATPPVDISSFATMFLGLVAVLALIFVVAWLSRKMKLLQHLGNGHQIKNLATLSLSHREKICLIEVGGKQLLIGLAPGRVNQLHVFEDNIELDNKHGEKASEHGFSEHFKKALGIASDRSIVS